LADLAQAAPQAPSRAEVRTITIDGHKIRVVAVRLPLKSVHVRVGLARDKVGSTEPLDQLAKRQHAVAAINGCFFDAYTASEIKNPHHTLVSNGKVLHLGGDIGCTMWFAKDGGAGIAKLHLKVVGALDGSTGWPNNWYAYWINRNPESQTTAVIFTPEWAQRFTPAGGISVVVRNGVVAATTRAPTEIPEDGFVLYLSGAEERQADRFLVGRRCEYWAVLRDASESALPRQVTEAIGCGPRLLQDGRIVADPAAEGFQHPKILSMACARSAIGLTADQQLVLATSNAATIVQLAKIMRAMGCTDAMNLDGGASSGLWYDGKYLTKPGRAISNSVLILSPQVGGPS
jgi:hypothetical protein